MMKKNKTGHIAKKLKQARLASGYSQKDLGKALRLSDKTISAYEQGRALPPLDTLQQISHLTNRPVSFFMEEGDDKELALQVKMKQIELELLHIRQILQEKGILDE